MSIVEEIKDKREERWRAGMVEIQDLQVRLAVEVEGVQFVTSWYGPRDKMRFAAVRSVPRELDPEEKARLEKEAQLYFTAKIKALEEALLQ